MAKAAHGPVVRVDWRMSFVTVLRASVSSIGIEIPDTRVDRIE